MGFILHENLSCQRIYPAKESLRQRLHTADRQRKLTTRSTGEENLAATPKAMYTRPCGTDPNSDRPKRTLRPKQIPDTLAAPSSCQKERKTTVAETKRTARFRVPIRDATDENQSQTQAGQTGQRSIPMTRVRTDRVDNAIQDRTEEFRIVGKRRTNKNARVN